MSHFVVSHSAQPINLVINFFLFVSFILYDARTIFQSIDEKRFIFFFAAFPKNKCEKNWFVYLLALVGRLCLHSCVYARRVDRLEREKLRRNEDIEWKKRSGHECPEIVELWSVNDGDVVWWLRWRVRHRRWWRWWWIWCRTIARTQKSVGCGQSIAFIHSEFSWKLTTDFRTCAILWHNTMSTLMIWYQLGCFVAVAWFRQILAWFSEFAIEQWHYILYAKCS